MPEQTLLIKAPAFSHHTIVSTYSIVSELSLMQTVLYVTRQRKNEVLSHNGQCVLKIMNYFAYNPLLIVNSQFLALYSNVPLHSGVNVRMSVCI